MNINLSAADLCTAIISTHIDASYSGVAKFGRELSRRLNSKFFGLAEINSGRATFKRDSFVLFSTKFSDLGDDDVKKFYLLAESIERKGVNYGVFLHSFNGTPPEVSLIKNARIIFVGNNEIALAIRKFNIRGRLVCSWCPSLLEISEDFSGWKKCFEQKDVLTILSFGMGYKFQADLYLQSLQNLRALGLRFRVLLSSSPHEVHGSGELDKNLSKLSQSVNDFKYLGNLTDIEICDFSHKVDLFLCPYEGGAKDNNTTLYAAAMLGIPVVTNVSPFSPSWLENRRNFIDYNETSIEVFEPRSLEQISRNCGQFVRRFRSWEMLVSEIEKNLKTI